MFACIPSLIIKSLGPVLCFGKNHCLVYIWIYMTLNQVELWNCHSGQAPPFQMSHTCHILGFHFSKVIFMNFFFLLLFVEYDYKTFSHQWPKCRKWKVAYSSALYWMKFIDILEVSVKLCCDEWSYRITLCKGTKPLRRVIDSANAVDDVSRSVVAWMTIPLGRRKMQPTVVSIQKLKQQPTLCVKVVRQCATRNDF